ncbi:hypothetical protein J6590_068415 [Homalodisca vitripennis]|nr:hypothetical protein J6590_092527 [Homalodisca vitripennis]KAG8310209.1 hypothetical protein J6590_068415 [Homalodisca vitripennis]
MKDTENKKDKEAGCSTSLLHSVAGRRIMKKQIPFYDEKHDEEQRNTTTKLYNGFYPFTPDR